MGGTNLENYVPGLRPYLMKQRGVFKTHVTRRGDFEFDANAIAEIDYNMEPLKPYLQHMKTSPSGEGGSLLKFGWTVPAA